MSSTGRGKVRDLDDWYATPPELARLICRRLAADLTEPGDVVNVLEPGCGAGSFLLAAQEAWPDAVVEGVELNPDLCEKARALGFEVMHGDILGTKPLKPDVDFLPDYHVIVGNPPFVSADAFINRLVHRLDPEGGFLAFLLRLNFLGGGARFENLWSKHRAERVYVMPARPGFTADGGSDSIEYAVAVWRHPSVETDATSLHWLDNRGVANKWPKGTLKDPRRQWFPSGPAPGDDAARAQATLTGGQQA